MDRTGRPDDDSDAPAGSGATDEAGVTDASDDGDRSALHVASEGTNWRFALDDLDEDGRAAEPLTPGTPDPEHAAFVLLGAALTLLVFSRFVL